MNNTTIRIEGRRVDMMSRSLEEMRIVYEKEKDPEMRQAYFEMCTEMQRIPGREEWACDWKACLKDGTIIGGAGFKGIPDDFGIVEIGYGVDEPYQNQGYATEMTELMVQWALIQPDVSCVQAQTEPGNKISQRVLEKNGFVYVGEGLEGPLFEVRK